MFKTKRDYAQDKLCREIGNGCRILRVDEERCIYRDFGNGFNVEVSGTHTTSKRRKAVIFLWYGSAFTVTCIKEVPFSEIGNVINRLYDYTCELCRTGAATEKNLGELRYERPQV